MIELPKRVGEHALSASPDRFPTLVYDLERLARRSRMLRDALPGPFSLIMPLGDAPPGMASALSTHADAVRVTTSAGLRGAMRDRPAPRTILSGSGKTEADLLLAVGHARDGRVAVSVDSPAELRLLAYCAAHAGRPIDVLLHADPDAGDGGEKEKAKEAEADHGAPHSRSMTGMDTAALVECAEVLRTATSLRARGFTGRLDGSAAGADPRARLRPWRALLGIDAPAYVFACPVTSPTAGTAPGTDPAGEAPWAGDTPWAAPLPAPPSGDERIAIMPETSPEAWCGWFLTPVLDVRHRGGRAYAVVEGGGLPAGRSCAVVPRDDAWRHSWERPHLTGEPVTITARGLGTERVLFPPSPIAVLRTGDLVAYPVAAPPPSDPPGLRVREQCLPID